MRSFGLLLLLFIFSGFTSHAVFAKTATKQLAMGTSQQLVRIPLTQAQNFTTALIALTEQAHVTIVCEDHPLHTELTIDEAKGDLAALEAGLPLPEAVKRIARAYDYTLLPVDERSYPRCIILVKQYTDGNDLPFITHAEALSFLEGILTVTKEFAPSDYRSDSLEKLLQSMSPEQKSQALEGIRVSALSDVQKGYAYQFTSGFCMDYIYPIRNIAQLLRACKSPNATFQQKTFGTMLLPVYVGPTVLHGGDQIVDIDPSRQPLLLKESDKKIVAPPSRLLFRLDDLAQRIKSPNTSKKGLKADIASGIGEKTVTVAGIANTAPDIVLRAAAAIYGLPVRTSQEPDILRVILPVAHVTSDLSQIKYEIDKITPLPLRRAVGPHLPLVFTIKFKDEEGRKVAEEAAQSFSSKTQARHKRLDDLYSAAVLHLRIIIEPKIEAKEDKKLRVLEAGEEIINQFALLKLMSCIYQVDQIEEPVPKVFEHFEEATIKLVPHGSGRIFDFAILYQNRGVRGAINIPQRR